MKFKGMPALIWVAMKAWRRSLTVADLMPACLNKRLIEARMFLTRKGWPVLVTNRVGSEEWGRFSR